MVTGIRIDETLCTRCGVCSSLCPGELITLPGASDLPDIPPDKLNRCLDCGHCEAFCPTKALSRNHETMLASSPDLALLTPELLTSYLLNRRSIRKFKKDPVNQAILLKILEIARYAPTGGNGQPVEWLIISDSEKIATVSRLCIDWLRNIQSPDHPLNAIIPKFLAQWDRGIDGICRSAPHLIIAHIPCGYHFPKGKPMAFVDGIITLTHVDIAAQVFGVGTCWAGLVAMAAVEYDPLIRFLDLAAEREPAYALMAGYPRFKPGKIPERKPLNVEWR